MKFADLEFYAPGQAEMLPEGCRDGWKDRDLWKADATFSNGMKVSIAFGPQAFNFWEPGLFVLLAVDLFGAMVPDLRVYGDEALMQKTLDRIERWRTAPLT